MMPACPFRTGIRQDDPVPRYAHLMSMREAHRLDDSGGDISACRWHCHRKETVPPFMLNAQKRAERGWAEAVFTMEGMLSAINNRLASTMPVE